MDNQNVYADLSDKAKEVAPQIENLLNGISFSEAEQLLFTLIQKLKVVALITV